MFAKAVVGSDDFLDLPATTQLLYFHLGVRADDDGFVGSPRSIMRTVGSSRDDLKLLCAKGFVIPFESGVVLIAHWRINNYIRSDRYHETVYLTEKETVKVEKSGRYTVGIPAGIPLVDPDKTSLGKLPLQVASTREDFSINKTGDAALNGRPPTPFYLDPDTGELVSRVGNP